MVQLQSQNKVAILSDDGRSVAKNEDGTIWELQMRILMGLSWNNRLFDVLKIKRM